MRRRSRANTLTRPAHFDTFKASLTTTYQDLFSNQSFDNSSSSWSYDHHTIHALQDLNL